MLNKASFLQGTGMVIADSVSTYRRSAAYRMKQAVGPLVQLCDGGTDEVEIQAALNALPSNGGGIQLSEGLFYPAAAINLNTGDVLQGMGAGTILQASAAMTNMITRTDLSARIMLKDFQIQGNSNATNGINFTGADGANVQRLVRITASGFTGTAVIMDGNEDSVLQDCTIENQASGTGVAWHVEGGNASIIGSLVGGLVTGIYSRAQHLSFVNGSIIGRIYGYGGLTLTNAYIMGHTNECIRTEGASSLWVISNGTYFIGSVNFMKGYFIGCSFRGGYFFNEAWSLSNGTGTATGSPVNLNTVGANPVDVTAAGTFTVLLPSDGAGTAVSDVATVVGSPVTLVPGSNTITVTGTGNININRTAGTMYAIELDDPSHHVDIGYILTAGPTFTGDHPHVLDNSTSAFTHWQRGWGGSGTFTILSGATSATITHGLGFTPALKDITITWGENPTNDPGNWWVDTIGATTFVVNVRNDPGASNLDGAWQVGIR